MENTNKLYLTAADVAEMLGVSVGHSYKIVKKMNDELKEQGFIVVSGKVPTRYFEQRCFGFGA